MDELETQVKANEGGGAKNWLAEIKELVKVLLVSLAIVLPVRYFIVQPFIVRGASMEPSFYDRDYLVVDELSYAFREPARGEVVVFRYPQDPRQFFIKRIIGLPGEQVEIKSGQVKIINSLQPQGFILEEPYLNNLWLAVGPDAVSVLGPQEYFVLGDNRAASSDSRFWGALTRKFLIGRAVFRAWPFSQFGIISAALP
jgi:signal peptidase I